MDLDEDPTCGFLKARSCERPKRCPVHRIPLLRPRKMLHQLRPERENPWGVAELPDGFPLQQVTVCGLFLHDIESEEERDKLNLGELLARSSRPGFQYPPIPSTVPGVTVYYRFGSSTYEVLVVAENPTCNVCRQSLQRRAASR